MTLNHERRSSYFLSFVFSHQALRLCRPTPWAPRCARTAAARTSMWTRRAVMSSVWAAAPCWRTTSSCPRWSLWSREAEGHWLSDSLSLLKVRTKRRFACKRKKKLAWNVYWGYQRLSQVHIFVDICLLWQWILTWSTSAVVKSSNGIINEMVAKNLLVFEAFTHNF